MFDPGFTSSHIRVEIPPFHSVCHWCVVPGLSFCCCSCCVVDLPCSLQENRNLSHNCLTETCLFSTQNTQKCPLGSLRKLYTTPWFPCTTVSWNVSQMIWLQLSGIKGILSHFSWCNYIKAYVIIILLLLICQFSLGLLIVSDSQKQYHFQYKTEAENSKYIQKLLSTPVDKQGFIDLSMMTTVPFNS